MASKSSPPFGEDALKGSADGVSDASPARRERGDRRSAAASPRELSEILEPKTSPRAPASFDRSSSREALIATAAYYRAEKRGFRPGHEIEDWLAAEREVDGSGTAPKL